MYIIPQKSNFDESLRSLLETPARLPAAIAIFRTSRSLPEESGSGWREGSRRATSFSLILPGREQKKI
ncbi:hypothetical protein [Geitlerinema sp. PCC 9228]|uniref:hypothetical protein n=1 Tax=Geitlerinema sp. PCC 9228 TaxID=111611 RepID=UPI001114B400|nr:hypothetical protein [Geitlerinema sp. PCC 9228]